MTTPIVSAFHSIEQQEKSDPAWWEMGLLDEADWEAEWIRKPRNDDDLFESNFFRTEFTREDVPAERARAYVSAYHQYELRLNGEEIDTRPSFNCPDRRYYTAIDPFSPVIRCGSRFPDKRSRLSA